MPRALTLAASIGLLCLSCERHGGTRAEELRVISLAPSVTRIVQALGAMERLVAVDEFSRRLPGVGLEGERYV